MMEHTGEAKDIEPLPGQRQSGLRQFDSSVLRAGSRETDRIGADATTDLQNALASPALELGKARYMRFYKVFASFNLVEVFPGSDRRTRMPDIARSPVPIGLNCGNMGLS